MTNLYGQLIGIPWFRPERYDAVRAAMSDAEIMPISYELWLDGAEKREQNTRRAGATPKRVYVDDDRFLAFCAEKKLLLNGKARSRFAVESSIGFKANIADYTHPDFWPGAKRK